MAVGKVNPIKTGRLLLLLFFLLPATGGGLQKSSLYIFKASYTTATKLSKNNFLIISNFWAQLD